MEASKLIPTRLPGMAENEHVAWTYIGPPTEGCFQNHFTWEGVDYDPGTRDFEPLFWLIALVWGLPFPWVLSGVITEKLLPPSLDPRGESFAIVGALPPYSPERRNP